MGGNIVVDIRVNSNATDSVNEVDDEVEINSDVAIEIDI